MYTDYKRFIRRHQLRNRIGVRGSMVKDKRIQAEELQPYKCLCGTVIAHKKKSLKKHLLTKAHIKSFPCPPHHWIIESASGHLSSGYCQNCNEQKKFQNSIEQFSWGGRAQLEYDKQAKDKEEQEELEHLAT